MPPSSAWAPVSSRNGGRHAVAAFVWKRFCRRLSSSAFVILFSLLFLPPLFAQDAPEPSPSDQAWKDAISALEKRQYPEAQKKFEDFTRRHLSDPRAAEATVRIGICDYRLGGRTARALDAWNRIVNMEVMQKRASPALLLALDQLAAHYRSQKNQRELDKTLGRLAEFFPANAITVREHASSARARLEAGDYTGAVALYGKVAAHLKGDNLLNYDLAMELSVPDSSVTAILVSAGRHLSENSVPLATRLYNEALKRDPAGSDKHEAMTKLGWCLYLQKKDKESERLWRSVIASAPVGDEWRGKSRWHLVVLNAGVLDNVKEAIALCDEQAKEFNSCFFHEQALFSKAWLLWTRKRWTEARAAFDELITHYPEKAVHPPIMQYIDDCDKGLSARR